MVSNTLSTVIVLALCVAGAFGAIVKPPVPTPIKNQVIRAEYKEPIFTWIGHLEKKTFYSVQASEDPEATMGWTAALDHCQELGMSLATIDSKAQDKLIADFLGNNGYAAWLSGTDFMSEGEWYWFKSRKTLTSTYSDPEFEPLQSISGPSEISNCLYTTYLQNWYSGRCEFGLRRAICQFP